MPDVPQSQLPDIEQTFANIAPASPDDYPLMPAPHLVPRELPHSLLVRTFRRRWRLMLIIFVILLAVGLSLSFIYVHPVYQAVAQLRFVPRPVVDGILTNADTRAGYSGYLNTELQNIGRRKIIAAAIGNLNLPAGDVNDLQSRTSVLLQDKGQMVSVIVSGSRPDGLVVRANAVAEAYLANDVLPQIEKHRGTTQQLREQLTAFRRDRKARLEILAGRDTEAYIFELRRRRDSYHQPLADARHRRDDAQADYARASAQLAALAASPADTDKVRTLLAELVKADPLLEMYRAIYQSMIATSDHEKLFSISSNPLSAIQPSDSSSPPNESKSTTDNQPDSDATKRATTIEKIRLGITQRLAELRSHAQDEAKIIRRAEIAAQQEMVDRKSQAHAEKDKALENLLAKDDSDASQITHVRQISGQVDKFDEQIEAHLEDLRKLAAELLPPAEPVLTELAALAPKVRDLRWCFMLGSALSAALLAVGCGSVLEHCDSRLTHAGDIVRRVGIPVLASLPSSDETGPDELWLPQEIAMADYVNDQYRNIRTAVLFGQGTPPRTIVVTAPTAAETKTTLSVNLAISMARAGRTVLLVDADLDHPALADVFDVPETPGWSDVLADPASVAVALCRTRVERLSVMPAGSRLEHSAELLSSPSCQALIDSLTNRFEHVIIDGPALLGCPEARIIAALADGVICSFSSRSTRSGQARRARAILDELGAAVIGSVLNT